MVDKGVPKALNLYGILDNELTRLHNLLLVYAQREHNGIMSQHIGSHGYTGGLGQTPSWFVQDRITKIQEIILQTVLVHDKDLQEKVAELALMSKDENGEHQ